MTEKRGRGGGHDRRHEASESYRINPSLKLTIPEIIKLQQETTIANFSFSSLTYKNSDRIVFIINGEQITTTWKKVLRNRNPWDQDDVRMFVSSALVTADTQSSYKIEELVTELGKSENGLKRLKEIIEFPMSCDAGVSNNKVLSFQYVILPLFGLLTRNAIAECTLEAYVLAIFMVVYTNLDSFFYNNVMKRLETLVRRNSVVDLRVSVQKLLSRNQYSFVPYSVGVFLLIIVRFLTELLHRIKEASTNETMHKIACDLQRLKTVYQQSIEQKQASASTDPLINNLDTRKYFFMILEEEMETMNKMMNNGRILEQSPNSKKLNAKNRESYRKVDTERIYDKPGESSKNGKRHDNGFEEISKISIIRELAKQVDTEIIYDPPDKRHDNDFEEISKISIIPTEDEILCNRRPFLPSPLPDAPHFLLDGAARLLDIQFRLLREDMLNPIRGGIINFLAELYDHSSSNKKNSKLEKILNEGGRFTYNNNITDNGDLQVYKDIKFVDVTCNVPKGLVCTLKFTPPPNFRNSTKKLVNDNLIAILLPNQDLNSDSYSIYFGVIMSRNGARVDIKFNNPSIYPIALNEILNHEKNKEKKAKIFMVESTSVYLEAYQHILKNLQIARPSSLPFEKYLAPKLDDREGKGKKITIGKPMYTRVPGFKFDLSVLSKYKQNLKLNVASTYDEVAKNIIKYSNISKPKDVPQYGLDKTQAEALIFALTREIALIEGPPGTGKTVIGVQIMKVLLAKENRGINIGPIIIICYTNHALDQFLEHLLDEGITENMVRLGTRTKSDKIQKYTLGKVRARGVYPIILLLEKIEEEVENIKISFKRIMNWNDACEYLKNKERRFFNKLNYVTHNDLPGWVLEVDYTNESEEFQNISSEESEDDQYSSAEETEEESQNSSDESEEESQNSNDEKIEEPQNGFQVVRYKRKKKSTIFAQWLDGEDIKIIKERKKFLLNIEDIDSDDEESQFIENYKEPITNRSLEELLEDNKIWKMSRQERRKLHDYWRANFYEEKLSILQENHEKTRQKMNELYDEERRRILLTKDVIGMTTSGAAKFQKLIRYIDPKIIVCEEAGEVLEAHILSALTPSTQHLILIGDHNQLRPHIATHNLSMDSSIGMNYQLDKSLFERLVDGNSAIKIEKTQLSTQRRMRKEISELIKETLYENLEDGDNTAKYPDVRGALHNVYFIDHRYPEDNSGSDLGQSHVNMYEVKMVVEMVKYFVRNGYTKPEDIAVLTPYLGQMSKIKEALSKSFVVVLDERDAENIADIEQEDENDQTDKKRIQKSLNQQVTLRTVDNFQGEEANIVIISLVRNFSRYGNGTIGFLKSKNRSNVLLSRAREGMYLLGNSELMAMKSKDMWAPVINILHKRNPPQIGFGMPIVCNRHPDYMKIITEPEQFAKFCPNGGCTNTCNLPLSCGHTCVFKCHSDNLNHIGVDCFKNCTKLHSVCGHPCPKLCYQDCGKCEFPIGDIILPGCGHTLPNAKCWQNQTKEEINCIFPIDIILPDCGHTFKNVECWKNKIKEKLKCKVLIDIILSECGHPLQNVECWKVKAKESFTCNFPIDITLPSCGHTLQNVECWKNKIKEKLKCNTLIDVVLPDCGHTLQNIECWKSQAKELPDCNTPIDIILSDCGHTLHDVECWKNKANQLPKCNAPVAITLPGCGHTLQNVKCWKIKANQLPKCNALVDITLPGCGHILNVECWKSEETIQCNLSIDVKLPSCGHTLQDVKCWKNQKNELPKCNTFVEITLPCLHLLRNVECWKQQFEEELPKCKNLVDITLSGCGHTLRNVECWKIKANRLPKCNALVDITLPCSHLLRNVECWKQQFEEELPKCNTPVSVPSPNCDHKLQNVKCWKSQINELPKCNTLIDVKSPKCGHILQGVKCWKSQTNELPMCNTLIDIELPCGHPLQSVECWRNKQIKETAKCDVLISYKFPDCGHMLRNVECSQIETIKCMNQVKKKLPNCEHFKTVQCSKPVNDIKCKEKCGEYLKCGHKCLKSCSECQKRSKSNNNKRTNHGRCKKICKTLLFCGHKCNEYCHEGKECPPCSQSCTVVCEHIKPCSKNCLEPCNICAKNCSWECKHQGKCELSCGTPCNRLPCNESCDKKLKCGHKCTGICGEICPNFCINCAPKKVKNQLSDRNIDWNKERMIILSCGHAYTMKTLDKLMGMKDYYKGSIEGGWTSIKELPTSTNTKTCPECQTPIKDIRRYGRIIKKHILDVQTKKFLVKHGSKLKEINKKINSFVSEDKIRNRRKKLKKELPKSELRPRGLVFKECDINKKQNTITPYNYFESIEKHHGFDEDSEQVWLDHVGPLLQYYRELISIYRASPHRKAFETTVSNLNAKGNSEDLSARVSNLTFQETLSQIGISVSQVDSRIHLDAFLEIINIQKILYHEILFIIDELSKEPIHGVIEDKDIITIKEVWTIFADKLQLSIQNHLHRIRNEAESTYYGRHLLIIDVEMLEIDLKKLIYQLKYPQNGIFDRALQDRIIKKCDDINKSIGDISRSNRYYNAEDELKDDIHRWLEILWKICEDVETCAENFSSNIDDKLIIHKANISEYN
ncbi:hypothetical protein C1645_870713 [Glomus cerebriforme]|uniref:NF-X1-type domain-containing protein n=1 Tax=Glomus cerebriforme TaxID=658196 RepID=A0A397TJT3_9GLOM|nr:hypothetical protein C1645_870713 [Glomus cerebriforme]